MSTPKQREFLTLYEPIHDRFERFCRARVFGNMEFRDLMNESLLIAFEKFDSLKSKESFLSFLIGISIRVLGNHYQKKKEDRIHSDNQLFALKDREMNPQQNADVHFLYEALSKLNDEQRECIILFEISGFSIKEIAVIQDTSLSSVKQRLKRGRAKLKEILTYESSLKTGEVSHG